MVKSSSFRSFFLIGLLQFLAFRAAPFAQHSPEPHGASVAVPRLITINGVLKDSGDGQSLGGIVGVTFAF
jgi:hypothetical protein